MGWNGKTSDDTAAILHVSSKTVERTSERDGQARRHTDAGYRAGQCIEGDRCLTRRWNDISLPQAILRRQRRDRVKGDRLSAGCGLCRCLPVFFHFQGWALCLAPVGARPNCSDKSCSP